MRWHTPIKHKHREGGRNGEMVGEACSSQREGEKEGGGAKG